MLWGMKDKKGTFQTSVSRSHESSSPVELIGKEIGGARNGNHDASGSGVGTTSGPQGNAFILHPLSLRKLGCVRVP